VRPGRVGLGQAGIAPAGLAADQPTQPVPDTQRTRAPPMPLNGDRPDISEVRITSPQPQPTGHRPDQRSDERPDQSFGPCPEQAPGRRPWWLLGISATTAAREAVACAVVSLVCIALGSAGVGGWAWVGAVLLSLTVVVHYCSWRYLSRGGPG